MRLLTLVRNSRRAAEVVEGGWLMMVKLAPTALSDQQNLARSRQRPRIRLPLSGKLIAAVRMRPIERISQSRFREWCFLFSATRFRRTCWRNASHCVHFLVVQLRRCASPLLRFVGPGSFSARPCCRCHCRCRHVNFDLLWLCLLTLRDAQGQHAVLIVGLDRI
jgi:hypothetical protein